MVRKRAPGGGRKPSGSAAQPLTIRINDHLRGQLEAAAATRAKQKQKRGLSWNLSQEILCRLRWSVNKEVEDRRNQAMHDLCWLISDMAKRELHTDLAEQQSWHRDPFTFRAFKVAVAKLLDRLEPKGEMRPPRALARSFEAWGDSFDAERLGEYAADKELIALELAGESTRDETSRWFGRGLRIDDKNVSPPLTDEEFEHGLNAFPRIRQTFGIEESGEE